MAIKRVPIKTNIQLMVQACLSSISLLVVPVRRPLPSKLLHALAGRRVRSATFAYSENAYIFVRVIIRLISQVSCHIVDIPKFIKLRTFNRCILQALCKRCYLISEKAKTQWVQSSRIFLQPLPWQALSQPYQLLPRCLLKFFGAYGVLRCPPCP